MLLHFPFLLAFIRFSKCQLLMVGGTEDLGKLIEVYHDDDSNSLEVPDFPFGTDVKNGAVGGTYFNSLHLICGGFNAGSDLVSQCYVGKNNGQWSAAGISIITLNGIFSFKATHECSSKTTSQIQKCIQNVFSVFDSFHVRAKIRRSCRAVCAKPNPISVGNWRPLIRGLNV